MYIIIFSAYQKIKYVIYKTKLSGPEYEELKDYRSKYPKVEFHKIEFIKGDPSFNKTTQFLKFIDLFSESIPQILIQLIIYKMKKNLIIDFFRDFLSLFSSSTTFNTVLSSQIITISTSFISIAVSINLFLLNRDKPEVFYYYKPEEIKAKTLRQVTIFIWYLLVVIPRLVLIFLLILNIEIKIFNVAIFTSFFLFAFIVSIITVGKEYFFSVNNKHRFKKYLKLICNAISVFMYSAVGVYKIIILKKEVNTEKGNTNWRYIVYYLLFWIQNIVFVLILFFCSLKSYLMILFIVVPLPIAVLFQIFYEMMERKKICNCFANCCKESEEEKNLNELLFKYEIYISGKSDSNRINKTINSLDDDYDLKYYNSSENKYDDEKKLVIMLGAKLFISIHGESSNDKEIATARRLNKPILFICEEISNYQTNFESNEKRIVHTQLEDTLKNYYKLITESMKKIFPYKYYDVKEYLESNDNVSSALNGTIYFLKNKLFFVMSKDNEQNCAIYTLENDKVEKVVIERDLPDSFKICVYNNNETTKLIVYNYLNDALTLNIFEVKSDQIEFLKVVNIENIKKNFDRIEVNATSNNYYGINKNTLCYFKIENDRFEIISEVEIKSLISIRVFKEELFVINYDQDQFKLSTFLGKTNELELKRKCFLIDNITFNFKCFDVNEKFIFLFGKFKNDSFNKANCVSLFLIDRKSSELTLMELNTSKVKQCFNFINTDEIFNFVVYDSKIIFLQTKKNLIKMEFNNNNPIKNNPIVNTTNGEELNVDEFKKDTFNHGNFRRNTKGDKNSEDEITTLNNNLDENGK